MIFNLIGAAICKAKGKHRYKVTETWDSDVATYSPCVRCGKNKKQDPNWPHKNEEKKK
jgi:hypothetical protein